MISNVMRMRKILFENMNSASIYLNANETLRLPRAQRITMPLSNGKKNLYLFSIRPMILRSKEMKHFNWHDLKLNATLLILKYRNTFQKLMPNSAKGPTKQTPNELAS